MWVSSANAEIKRWNILLRRSPPIVRGNGEARKIAGWDAKLVQWAWEWKNHWKRREIVLKFAIGIFIG